MLRLLDKNSLYRCPIVTITDPAELEHAEQQLFHSVQSESFPSEKSNLLKSSPLSRTSKIAHFSPFVGPNGLIRASGRSKQLNVATIDVKHSVVLDGRHPMVRILLEHLYKNHCHQGVDYLRALVQQRFAVVTLRTSLRTIVSRCITCRKRRAKILTPMMSDLPRERLAFKEPPFSNTDIDCFGPSLYLSNDLQRIDGAFFLPASRLVPSFSRWSRAWTQVAA